MPRSYNTFSTTTSKAPATSFDVVGPQTTSLDCDMEKGLPRAPPAGYSNQRNESSAVYSMAESNDARPPMMFFWKDLARACIAEFLGTATFVMIGSLSSDNVFAPQAHGLTITLLIITFGHISGGHFNPAVTTGICLAGGIHWLKAIFYFFTQLLGGFVGALFVRALANDPIYDRVQGGITIPGAGVFWGDALSCELVLTYIFVQTIILVAVDSSDNKLAPFAIGLTLMCSIIAGGQISGSSLNPARSFGPAVAYSIFAPDANNIQWTYHYIYWAGPIVGAAIAALIYRLLLANREKRWLLK